MVSGDGASQASPRGVTEASAAGECVEGFPHSPIGSPGLDTASPKQEGLPSILTIGAGRTDGGGESEARSDSLDMSETSPQPQMAGSGGSDRARDATCAVDGEQSSTGPDRKEPLYIAKACAAETIQENGNELAAAGMGSTHFKVGCFSSIAENVAPLSLSQ